MTDFAEIRADNRIYADKTEFLYNLLQYDAPLFLSRPRRFGKTLLVDTLENILRGRRELFKGLWIDGSDYDWTPNPVIRLNLNGIDSESVAIVKEGLITALDLIAESEGLSLSGASPTTRLTFLFNKLFLKYGRKVALLIDEYDAPVLNQLENPILAEEIGRVLKSFYNVIKANESQRGFTLLIGI
ncbi:MAG: AAA family ATPase, partial [Deltaproteobacteria bacterium]|nr:AAA family ATPase [Deltaproteobacteria bacterium]